MTKKLVLALFAFPAVMADSACTPQQPIATGNFFAIEGSVGWNALSGNKVGWSGNPLSNLDDDAKKESWKNEQLKKLDKAELYLQVPTNDSISNKPLNPNPAFDSNERATEALELGGYNVGDGLSIPLEPKFTSVSIIDGTFLQKFRGVPFNTTSNSSYGSANGFFGNLALHYMMNVPNTSFGLGVYAGLGVSNAKSSKKVSLTEQTWNAECKQAVENSTFYLLPDGAAMHAQYQSAELVANGFANGVSLEDPPTNKNFKGSDYKKYTVKESNTYGPIGTLASPHMGNPTLNGESRGTAKATVSSGFMLQAGTRLGMMMGNVFPHIRLGWAAYQLQAKVTNQLLLSGDQKSNDRTYSTEYGGNMKGVGGGFAAKGTGGVNNHTDAPNPGAYPQTVVVLQEKYQNNPEYEIIPYKANYYAKGMDQAVLSNEGGEYTGTVSPVTTDVKMGNITSKYKWANALTLGAGVDWAYRNMTFGVYYQASICQNVIFDSWKGNSRVITGTHTITGTSQAEAPTLTDVDPNGSRSGMYPASAKDGARRAMVINTESTTKGTSLVKYQTAKVGNVNYKPVINTMAFTVKYCFAAPAA